MYVKDTGNDSLKISSLVKENGQYLTESITYAKLFNMTPQNDIIIKSNPMSSSCKMETSYAG